MHKLLPDNGFKCRSTTGLMIPSLKLPLGSRRRINASGVKMKYLGKFRYVQFGAAKSSFSEKLISEIEKALFSHATVITPECELKSLQINARRASEFLAKLKSDNQMPTGELSKERNSPPYDWLKQTYRLIQDSGHLTTKEKKSLTIGLKSLCQIIRFTFKTPAPWYRPPCFSGNSFSVERWHSTMSRWINESLIEYDRYREDIKGRKIDGASILFYRSLPDLFNQMTSTSELKLVPMESMGWVDEIDSLELAKLSRPLYRFIVQIHIEILAWIESESGLSAPTRKRLCHRFSEPSEEVIKQRLINAKKFRKPKIFKIST